MDAARRAGLDAPAAAAAAARSIQPTTPEREEWGGRRGGGGAGRLTADTQTTHLYATLFTLDDIYKKGRMAQMGGVVLMKRQGGKGGCSKKLYSWERVVQKLD